MPINDNFSLPTGSENIENKCPPYFHNHLFIPPKPALTKQEEHQKMIHLVNESLGRVINLENELRSKVDVMLSNIGSDNVEFKNLMTDAYNHFSEAVKNEVNSFESLITNSYDLFKQSVEADITAYENDFNAFKQNVYGIVNEFEENVNESVRNINSSFNTNLPATVRQQLRSMKQSGEMQEIIEHDLLSHLVTKNEVNNLATKEELNVERERINLFVTSGNEVDADAELLDVRVDGEGETHGSAGDAVRSQYLKNRNRFLCTIEGGSPFTPHAVKNSMVIKYGNFVYPKHDKVSYSFINADDYANASSGDSTLCGSGCELITPIPYESDLDMSLVVIAREAFDGTFYLSSRNDTLGGPNCNTALSAIKCSEGLNIIHIENPYREGDTENDYVLAYIAGEGVQHVECAYLYSSNVLHRITEASRIYGAPSANSASVHCNNCTATFVYDEENGRYNAHVDARRTDDAEWRYCIGSVELEKGKKYLVRCNDDHDYFGLSKTRGSACIKYLSAKKGEVYVLDVDTEISGRESEFDKVYLSQCWTTPNPAVTFESEAQTISFDVVELYGFNNSIATHVRLATFDPNDYPTRNELDEVVSGVNDAINGKIKSGYITCWGDSLTALGGWTDVLSERSGMELYNAGTGGEGSNTIAARQGADCMAVNGVTIPSSITEVSLGNNPFIETWEGKHATPMRQNSPHVNPVTIAGISGNLNWNGSYYTFTRNAEGTAKEITYKTPIITNYDKSYNDPYLMVIYVGANGGYDSIPELVRTCRRMVEHSKARNYIVLGFTSGAEGRTAESMAEYESAMTSEFGRYFISLRDYLSKQGMKDAGLEPTADDLAKMAEGAVPYSLFVDEVHYTDSCKTVIGNMLYERCKELGIF